MPSYARKDPLNPRKWIIDTTITLPDKSRVHLKRTGYFSKTEAIADFERAKNELLYNYGFKNPNAFQNLIDDYLVYKQTKVKISTLVGIKGRIKKYLNFNNIPLMTVYTDKFLSQFKLKINKLTVSQGVKNKILQIFREASEFAFNREVISLAMYRKSKIYLEYIVNQEKPKARVYRIWTHEQYDKFISTFKENDKYRPLFRWMFFSGARIGETCALQWKDFDAEKKTIHIYKTASARIGIGKSVIMTTKTRAGDRFILLNEQMFNDIMDLKVAFGENPESFLFFGYEEPIGHTTIRTVFNNHIRLAGLPRIKIHEIRHTNNTWLLDENQSRAAADIVTKRLGRSSLKVTLDTYYHSNPVVEESIVEKIKI